jgi:hypothetical protein
MSSIIGIDNKKLDITQYDAQYNKCGIMNVISIEMRCDDASIFDFTKCINRFR